MKKAVGRRPFQQVVRGGSIERFHHLDQRFYIPHVRFGPRIGCNAHGMFFHDHAEFEYFHNFIMIQRSNYETAPRAQRNETLRLQTTEGFPDRHAAGAEPSGKQFLTNFASGDELSGQESAS